MLEYLKVVADFLGAERYWQHSICLTSDPVIMTVFVAGDLTTWAAYFTMGIALLTKRERLVHLSPAAIGMYGAFIFICGASHLMDVVVLWSGVYRLDAALTMAMAAISAVTATYTAVEVWGRG
jgi:hypothetical protein